MWNWLRTNAWMANWTAVIVALVIALVQGLSHRAEKFNWARLVTYFAFFASFAAMLSPATDMFAKGIVAVIAVVSFLYIFMEAFHRLQD